MNESFTSTRDFFFFTPAFTVCTSAIFTINTTAIIPTINNITVPGIAITIIYRTFINYFDSQHEHYLTAVKTIATSITPVESMLLQVKL